MFKVNDDLSISVNRGDIVCFGVEAKDDQEDTPYKFQPGDILRVTVYGKKDAEDILLQKDFPVSEICETVSVYLSGEETTIGDPVSKPRVCWYDIKLNPDTEQQTIVGYFEDGPVLLTLYPEGVDLDTYEPDPEDFPVVDDELDASSHRPVSNRAVTRELVALKAELLAIRQQIEAV